ncbi:MAG: bifunctional diaminohydroxyphosphoribosylaminopyrimidine deaminase/5-amino-6-(5-phosphoribosylamino)uracil reductase RibD [Pseudomonadota bacterium]
MFADTDTVMMARAIELAEQAVYRCRPNPAVGCVLVKEGLIIGEGSTQPAGGNHGEVEALNAAKAAGHDPAGATVYVSLEPCNHTGRTGPCSEALVAAGVSRVVTALQDPNPQVSGSGLLTLSNAGIAVDVGLMEVEAGAINPGFFKRMRTGLPWVRLKSAASLDGRTAMASGESQWITGPEARADVQRLRARSGAIITGIGTVLADNPKLTVRDDAYDIPAQPLRVVLDSTLQTPADAAVVNEPGDVLLIHSDAVEPDNRSSTLEVAHDAATGLDLLHVLRELGAREVNEVLVECGARLAGSFLQAGLVDEWVLYTAPTLLGSDARPLALLPLSTMAEQQRFTVEDLTRVGDDVRWMLKPNEGNGNGL